MEPFTREFFNECLYLSQHDPDPLKRLLAGAVVDSYRQIDEIRYESIPDGTAEFLPVSDYDDHHHKMNPRWMYNKLRAELAIYEATEQPE